MHLAVLGSEGQLGQELMRLLAGQHQLTAWPERELDITDTERLEAAIAATRPQYVINAAAYTDVDAAERDSARAHAINAEAPAQLARICAAGGLGLLHFSTDYVFDGARRRPYREDDLPHPLQVYGRSKRAGEVAVLAACPQALVVRTAWLYGAHGPNFVRTILKAALERPRLEVVDDQRGSPTSAQDLAAVVAWLIRRRPSGLLHVTNAGDCTWHEFAGRILKLRGIATPVDRITSAALNRPARRPAYSVLDTQALRVLGAPPLRHWEEALAAYLLS